MKPILSFLLLVFVGLAAAWSKDDYEIFSLRDDVATSEGTNVTFYDFLEIPANANQDKIIKAHRKKSRTLHPDKVTRTFIATYKTTHEGSSPSKRQIETAVKEANTRSARLNLVANVLKGPGRDRYDHFLKHGFPLWKGTGYYYSRFRPGLGSVLIGLFLVFGGAAHYGALILGWKRQREFVGRYVRQARRAAWGDEIGVRGLEAIGGPTAPAPAPTPAADSGSEQQGAVAMNRPTASASASGTSTPTEGVSTGERKRVVAENGKVLIVDSVGNVFLEEEDEEGVRKEFLLDVDEIQKPGITETMVFQLPIWCFNKTVGRVFGSADADVEEEVVDEDEVEAEAEAVTSATSNTRSRRRGKRSQR
ncbi:hypothetical protein N7533_012534 [Penicillium manginii]|uniref:uncharacterized protein n=1 Tax=Penicillium manginii TaxID=203109 RepID=UPI0025495E28|nr:uncharacterized protein N7533_012534 [Penicillium manginii]KAJ5739750.1 hypothetical protein N7533_012534 [Penicillium manginii]